MTQKQLAQKADLDETQLGRYLKGHTSPSFEAVERVAVALGVPPFYLLMSPEERALWDAKSAPKSDLEARVEALERGRDAREQEIQKALRLAEKIKAERAAEALP